MLRSLTIQEPLPMFYFPKDSLMSRCIYLKRATKAMSGTSMQHLWKYGSRQFILSLLLNWSSGTPLLKNNKYLHPTTICPGFPLGKTPPAAQIPFPCRQFQAEEAWQLYVLYNQNGSGWGTLLPNRNKKKKHNCCAKSLLNNLVCDLVRTFCVNYCAAWL